MRFSKPRFGANTQDRQQPHKSRRLTLEILEQRTLLSVLTVVNTEDSGPGSLRQAILDANIQTEPVTIQFQIAATDPNFVDIDSHLPGGDVDPDAFVIKPLSALPAINNPNAPIVLDARTQATFGSDTNPWGPEIVLDGSLAGDVDGLGIRSAGNIVAGLNVCGFARSGIGLTANATHNSLLANYIGTDPTGTIAVGNGLNGIWINASDNVIGQPGAGNLISGNGQYGIAVGTSGNRIQGNLIGVSINGATAIGNTYDGIAISGPGNLVGGTGPGQGNVVSANGRHGIAIRTVAALGNEVLGNLIGTDATGTAGLGNLASGISIESGANSNRIGGADPGARNVISANAWSGIRILVGSSANSILGNYIGTDASGTGALGNTQDGIALSGAANFVGGTGPGEGNVISANGWHGIAIRTETAVANEVLGNFIGTDATGTAGLGNFADGIRVEGGASSNRIGGADPGARNVISANAWCGIWVGSPANSILGNYIGTDASGTQALGNTKTGITLSGAQNFVGGAAPGEGNVISANGSHGIGLNNANAFQNEVLGNFIGTARDGTAGLGNLANGISIAVGANTNQIGGPDPGARNVISANAWSGIAIDDASPDNSILGNYIGTDVSGTVALGNAHNGVATRGARTVIGRSDAGNVISANARSGILTSEFASESRIQGNLIGTDVSGGVAMGNGYDGISLSTASNLVGGTGLDEGNVVSANGAHGIAIRSDNGQQNVIVGNFIGTDSTGAVALGNSVYGVAFGASTKNNRIGAADPAGRNVISGNAGGGISIHDGSSGNRVLGNYVGTNATGTDAIGNSGIGIRILNSAGNTIGEAGAGNVVSGNLGPGIRADQSPETSILANFVGTNAAGTEAIANSNDGILVVGGSHRSIVGQPGAGNLASGNAWAGMSFSASEDVVVQANLIGTDALGEKPLPNGRAGIWIGSGSGYRIGGSSLLGESNVISGNTNNGITFDGAISGAIVTGNLIGTDKTGAIAVPNGKTGVALHNGAHDNAIGGTAPGEANTIAFNASIGVAVVGDSTVANSIRGNRIYGNGGLAIDLGADGLTANDAYDRDDGPNRLQNAPVLRQATYGSTATVIGEFTAEPLTTLTLDFYAQPELSYEQHAAPTRHLGSQQVAVGEDGIAYFKATTVSIEQGEWIIASATDTQGNTSELSWPRQAREAGVTGSSGTDPWCIFDVTYKGPDQSPYVNQRLYEVEPGDLVNVALQYFAISGNAELGVEVAYKAPVVDGGWSDGIYLQSQRNEVVKGSIDFIAEEQSILVGTFIYPNGPWPLWPNEWYTLRVCLRRADIAAIPPQPGFDGGIVYGAKVAASLSVPLGPVKAGLAYAYKRAGTPGYVTLAPIGPPQDIRLGAGEESLFSVPPELIPSPPVVPADADPDDPGLYIISYVNEQEPRVSESTYSNNRAAVPFGTLLRNYRVGEYEWNARGGLAMSYFVEGAPTPSSIAPKIAFYWASGNTLSDVIPWEMQVRQLKTSAGKHSVRIGSRFIARAPEDATHLIAVLDDGNGVPEFDEGDNIKPIPLRDRPNFYFKQDSPDSYKWLARGGLRVMYWTRGSIDSSAANPTIAFLWARGPELDDALPNVPPIQRPQSMNTAKRHSYATLKARRLQEVPEGATHVLAVLDYDGKWTETTEEDNVLAVDLPVLLRIDGDNNNGTALPDGSDAEKAASRPIVLSSGEYEEPGKIVIVNDGDVDNDGVPDYAAGFNQAGQSQLTTVVGVAGNNLVPMVVWLPDDADPENAILRFNYSDSYPMRVRRAGEGEWNDPWVYWIDAQSSSQLGSLRLWTRDGAESRDFASDFVVANAEYAASGGMFSLVELFPGGPRGMKLYVEAVRPSEALADLSITVDIDPDGPGRRGFVYTDTIRITAVDLTISLDDRRPPENSIAEETRYVDVTSATRPFPFWLNDDYDSTVGETEDGLADGDEYAVQRVPDNDDNRVIRTRDLEDFLSFQVTASLLSKLGDNFGLRLSFEGVNSTGSPSVHVFESPEGVLGPGYLYDESQAAAALECADTHFVGAVSVLNTARLYSNADVAQFLLEGVSSGTGAFTVTLVKLGVASETVIGSDEAYLDLQPMESPRNADGYDFSIGRYDHFTVGDTTDAWPSNYAYQISDQSHLPLPPIRASGRSDTQIGAGVAAGEGEPERDYILFVHGWRMTQEERRHFAETAYKRLFWQGYRGDFGLFSWPTEYTERVGDPGVPGGVPADASNYNRSEEKAWNSATGLHAQLRDIAADHPGRLNVFAHSMGNIVVSEALRKEAEPDPETPLIHTYVASQAATPAAAYDSTVESRIVPGYWDTPEIYGSFPREGEDPSPYFGDIGLAAENRVNFFNPDDPAFSALAWELNQGLKPDTNLQRVYDASLWSYTYNSASQEYAHSYDPSLPFGWVKYQKNLIGPNPEPVELASASWEVVGFPSDHERYQVFSYIAEARSRALGTQEGIGGPFTAEIDLAYGDNAYWSHSAQFLGDNMRRGGYWCQLLDSFEIGLPGHEVGGQSIQMAARTVSEVDATTANKEAPLVIESSVAQELTAVSGIFVTPEQVSWQEDITLTADVVLIPDDEVVRVEFYRDINGDSQLEVPNNSFESAAVLDSITGPAEWADLSIHNPDDVDLFQFEVLAGGDQHYLDVLFLHDDADLDVALYDESQTLVRSGRARPTTSGWICVGWSPARILCGGVFHRRCRRYRLAITAAGARGSGPIRAQRHMGISGGAGFDYRASGMGEIYRSTIRTSGLLPVEGSCRG